MCNLFICLVEKIKKLVICVFHSCWWEIPSNIPTLNTKWGPQVAKKIFFRPKWSENFFISFRPMRTKDEKKFFGLCENLVEISGGVEIFSPEIARKFFG